MGIYGCWSISGDVKGLWLRAGVKTWTLLSQRPSQEYARLISITANSAPRSSVSFFCSLSICLSLSSSASLVCICMSSNSPRTPNPCIRYFLAFSLTSQAVTTTKYDKVQLLLSWQLEILRKLFFFTFIWHLSEYLFPPPLYPPRFWARCHGDASRRLLGPVTSLPGRAGGRVHRKEQAGDSDLPLHPGHADLLQVQRRVGSPRWPLDWTDCWPSNRYTRRKICEPHR